MEEKGRSRLKEGSGLREEETEVVYSKLLEKLQESFSYFC